MRIALIGAGQITLATARALLEQGHEVVIVEEDEARLADLEDLDLDCGLMHGDGSRPAVLEQLDPENTDFLFCATGSDQDNILAALAGKKLGFPRVALKISDPDFRSLCAQLGLEDLLVPSQEIANAVVDRVSGIESADLSPLIDTGMRFFCFAVGAEEAGDASALELPEGARLIAILRNGDATLPDGDAALEEGDEIYLLCRQKDVPSLRKRFVEGKDGGRDGGKADDGG